MNRHHSDIAELAGALKIDNPKLYRALTLINDMLDSIIDPARKTEQSTDLRTVYTLYTSGEQHTAPTTTSERSIKKIPVPASLISYSEALRITVAASAGANNANAKTVRVRFGNGTTDTTVMSFDLANGRWASFTVWIFNRRDTTGKQVVFTSQGLQTTAIVELLYDTTKPMQIDVTVQKANSADVVLIEAVTVELLRSP